MADKKISELTALTGANVATDDQLVIVDTSAALTKSITIDEFKNALDTATGFVRITGDTMTGNLSMGDNVKAIFGAGSDLQIYHDGSNSHIKDAGTGGLIIKGESSVQIRTSTANEAMLYLSQDGAVQAFYDGSIKLATTSTGVDITGTLTSDGLSVNTGTTGTIAQFRGANTDLLNVDGDTDAIALDARNVSSLSFEIQGTKAMKIDNANDISFYEDTGTTAKFFWDASAESLGIGTSSPSAKLHSHVGASSTTGVLAENANDAASTGDLIKAYSARGNTSAYNLIKAENSIGVKFLVAGSGNVGIGTSSPEGDGLHIQASDNNNDDDLISLGFTFDANSKVLGTIGVHNSASNTGGLKFSTKNAGTLAEAMRLTSTGELLVGTTDTTPYNNSAGTSADQGFVVTSGRVFAATNSNSVSILNRTGTDGDIVQFRKDGSAVGSIGTANTSFGTNPYIAGSGGRGLSFDVDVNRIFPCSSTGARADGSADLGASTARFKDLYLSGGVVFGDAGGSGTSTSNTLDSYEEGTWTPTFDTGTATTIGQATYTKIGRSVTLCVENLKPSDTTSSNVLKIQSLPFAPANGAGGSMGSIMAQYRDDDVGISCYIPNNVSEIRVYETSVTGGFNALSHAAMFNNSAGAMYFSITYFTT